MLSPDAVRTLPSPRLGTWVTVTAVAVIALATLVPQDPTPELAATPWWCLVCGSRGSVDVILNVILFLPLGVGLALRIPHRGRTAVVVGAVLSLLIELSQAFLVRGRDASLSDLLTNTLGTALGVGLWRYHAVLIRPSSRLARRLTLAAVTLWLTLQGGTTWSLAPDLPPTRYFSQLAPDLGQREVFDGQVRSATLGPIVLTSGPLDDSDDARRMLRSGTPLTATICVGSFPATPAPIVNLADEHQRQIAGLAQVAHQVRFALRLRASGLHLQTPVLSLPAVLPGSGDSVTIAGWFADGRLNAQARHHDSTRVITVAFSPSWTWLLLAPGTVPLGHATPLITALWLLASLLPLGAWAHRAALPPGPAVVLAGTLLAVGLGVIPVVGGLPAAHWPEWVGAGLGLACGAWLGRLLSSSEAGMGIGIVRAGAASPPGS